MGAEKGGPKNRGFFHIFDWSRKSRKKLFSISPESTKQEKRTDANTNGTKLILVDEDEPVGISSVKGSSDYSCASSITDERNGIREPGVVARLMGLESIPTSSILEPYSTPFFDTKSLSHKRSSDILTNEQFNHACGKTEAHRLKLIEFRSQKMPSSPIERFQTETLPPRLAKAVPQIHHRLTSPIKNPGFIYYHNVAQIMETTAKILEPALSVKTRTKVSSSYGPLKGCETHMDRISPSPRTSRVLEFSRRPAESNDMKYLKGHSLNRSWNGSEDRSPQDNSDTNSLNGMGKGKSVSLAIQAKVNVQKREGLSMDSRSVSSTVKDVDQMKSNHSFKSHTNSQKIRQYKKASTSGGSSVLRQNNQKQNCLSGKGKIAQKQLISNQHDRKILRGDTFSRKNENTTRSAVNSRVVREETLDTLAADDAFLSSNKDFPRKKRLTEQCFNSQRTSSVDNSTSKLKQHFQPEAVIDEQSRWNNVKKSDCCDVVSFTFNSPLVKSRPSPSTIPVKENDVKRNMCTTDSNIRKNNFTAKKISSHGHNMLTGDALSLLLEQKLRELTSSDETSYCNFADTSNSSSSMCLKQEKVFDNDSRRTNSIVHEKQLKPRITCRTQQPITFSCGDSSTNSQVFGFGYNLQLSQEAEYSSTNELNKSNDLQPSPQSILEASFSESCNSSLTCTSSDGNKRPLHAVQTRNIFSSQYQKPSTEAELEQSYSISSSSSEQSLFSSEQSLFSSEIQSNCQKRSNPDLTYLNELLRSRRSCAMNLALRHLDPLLFNKLEKIKGGKDGKLRRKMMFDCVNECLKSRRRNFLLSGYRAWAKGEAMMPIDMAESVYEEISGWEGFGDCLIDELVDRDMCSQRGRWVNFEAEAFELGMEMEKEIIDSLIDEVFFDVFVKS